MHHPNRQYGRRYAAKSKKASCSLDYAEQIIDDIYDVADNIQITLYDYAIGETMLKLVFEVDGDWKHDHLRFDYLVGKYFDRNGIEYIITDGDVTDDYGGEYDVWRGTHNIFVMLDDDKCASRKTAGIANTFFEDFTIADMFGKAAVQDTFDRAFREWKDDYRYLTALVIALNHKIWQHYETNEGLARLYNDLWMQADAYACDNLKDDELLYFYRETD